VHLHRVGHHRVAAADPEGQAKDGVDGLLGDVSEIKQGLSYIAHEPPRAGVIVGLGIGLIGAGAIIPLGPVYANAGLGGDIRTYGLLLTGLRAPAPR
jgi:hypothetical protein